MATFTAPANVQVRAAGVSATAGIAKNGGAQASISRGASFRSVALGSQNIALSATRRQSVITSAIAKPEGAKKPDKAPKGDSPALETPPSPGQNKKSLYTIDDLNQATAAEMKVSQGLVRIPLSGGVENATDHNRLPSPAVAVRNLMEQARFATMCSTMSSMHHRRSGYPFGSLVDFATDTSGCPIFSLSPLAVHTRNIQADPRCTMNVTMPGWTGLANARVTLFGDVYLLPEEQQVAARELFRNKHERMKHTNQYGNFNFYRMHTIKDIYFVGGFGTVQWINVREYLGTTPDKIVGTTPHNTLNILNEKYSKTLTQVLTADGLEIDDTAFISIDAQGVEVRIRCGAEFKIERIQFPSRVETVDEAVEAMRKITDMTRVRLPGKMPDSSEW